MKRKIGIVFMLLGLGLLLCAMSLIAYNIYDEERVSAQTEALLEVLVKTFPEETKKADEQRDEFLQNSQMRTITVDGNQYIGVLNIPCLDLSFPVMNEWSTAKLKIAPCRYTGSIFDDSLVIAAHNYKRHFGGIKLLKPEDLVNFIDIDGNIYSYHVSFTETLGGTAVDEMVSGDWDLTLFTCTYGGKNRIAVRCERIQ